MSHHSSGADDDGATCAASSPSSPTEQRDSASIPSPGFSSGSVLSQGAAMEPSRNAMRCRVGLAITGISLGLMVFLVFLAVEDFRNYHISGWGLVSGIFAGLTLIVHAQHLKGNRDLWLNRLKLPIIVGFIVQLGSIAAFITYIVLAIVQKQSLMPLNGPEKGYYVTAVWIFMTWKWSFALFWYSRSYRRFYITKYVSIP